MSIRHVLPEWHPHWLELANLYHNQYLYGVDPVTGRRRERQFAPLELEAMMRYGISPEMLATPGGQHMFAIAMATVRAEQARRRSAERVPRFDPQRLPEGDAARQPKTFEEWVRQRLGGAGQGPEQTGMSAVEADRLATDPRYQPGGAQPESWAEPAAPTPEQVEQLRRQMGVEGSGHKSRGAGFDGGRRHEFEDLNSDEWEVVDEPHPRGHLIGRLRRRDGGSQGPLQQEYDAYVQSFNAAQAPGARSTSLYTDWLARRQDAWRRRHGYDPMSAEERALVEERFNALGDDHAAKARLAHQLKQASWRKTRGETFVEYLDRAQGRGGGIVPPGGLLPV